MPGELPRFLTLKDATMIVVSSIIGVGIFLTPSEVARLVPEPSLFLAAWVLGGVLSLGGALANAELGAMLPRAGGNYVYLREAIHPVAGFVVGWQSFFAIFMGTVATLGAGVATSVGGIVDLNGGAKRAVAIFAIALVSLANVRSTKMGALLNTATGFAKLLVLAGLVILGLTNSRSSEFLPVASPAVSWISFGAALSPVLFSYLGWNASVYVGGEIRNPGKNIPRSLLLGLLVSTMAYLAIAFVYVRVLGMRELAAQENAGMATSSVLFGARGAVIANAMVLLSIVGCLYANVLTGPRIVYAMARDGLFFEAAGVVSPKGGAPAFAISLQALGAIVLVLLFRDLQHILDYTTFAIVLATIADTLALYLLRWRLPHQDRPYRAFGYPWMPLLYIAANIAIAVAMLLAKPRECLFGLVVLVSGFPAYYFFARQRRKRPS